MSAFVATRQIDGPAGSIEVASALPVELPPRQLGIVCHPHPLFGGTMSNKVVTSTERCFRDLGFATVRFNFRGIGASAGSFDHGKGESEDLRAVFEFARSHFPELPLCLAGFSFGSFVATRMANILRAAQLVSIAPPVLSWDFRAIDPPTMPWLIVQGEQDEVVDPAAVYHFADQQQPPPTLIRMPEASHFFHGKLLELREVLSDWLQASEAAATEQRAP